MDYDDVTYYQVSGEREANEQLSIAMNEKKWKKFQCSEHSEPLKITIDVIT